MDASRLLALANELLRQDKQYEIQPLLEGVAASIQNLSNSPQQSEMQVAVADSVASLKGTLESLAHIQTPADLKALQELHAQQYFTRYLVEAIEESVAENGMTPAVAEKFARSLVEERQEFLDYLENIANGLSALGFEPTKLEEGEAEVGFQLPRALFNNELSGLIDELRAVQRMVRTFSEVATGSAEPIEVRQISTSDPTFWLLLGYGTAHLIGRVTTWALDRWKTVEEIRNLREQTRKSGVFTKDEIEGMFDKKIKETVDQAIADETEQLIAGSGADPGRKNELRTAVKWALEALLGRIERGMTIEIRYLPPPAANEEVLEGNEESVSAQQEMARIVSQLVFPAPSSHPVLKLPKLPTANDNSKPKPADGPKP